MYLKYKYFVTLQMFSPSLLINLTCPCWIKVLISKSDWNWPKKLIVCVYVYKRVWLTAKVNYTDSFCSFAKVILNACSQRWKQQMLYMRMVPQETSMFLFKKFYSETWECTKLANVIQRASSSLTVESLALFHYTPQIKWLKGWVQISQIFCHLKQNKTKQIQFLSW